LHQKSKLFIAYIFVFCIVNVFLLTPLYVLPPTDWLTARCTYILRMVASKFLSAETLGGELESYWRAVFNLAKKIEILKIL
jgi:hypothetical protein